MPESHGESGNEAMTPDVISETLPGPDLVEAGLETCPSPYSLLTVLENFSVRLTESDRSERLSLLSSTLATSQGRLDAHMQLFEAGGGHLDAAFPVFREGEWRAPL